MLKSQLMKIVFAIGLFSSTVAMANSGVCVDIFSSTAKGPVVLQDPYQQWLLWEETANDRYFVQPTDAIELKFSKVPSETAEIQVAQGLPDALLQLFKINSTELLVPRHPLNTYKTAPFALNPIADQVFAARYSASRSIPIELADGIHAYSLKLPTSVVNPGESPNSFKVDNLEDVALALPRTNMIDKIDAAYPEERRLLLAKEVLTIADIHSKNGIVVRDTSFLKDGHYYLPAFSIPHVGKEIAEKFGQPYIEFWNKHYAEKVGMAKAIFLLRYGLTHDFPHLQNILVQLDRNLMPTGTIVFRDLTDTTMIRFVSELLDLKDELNLEVNLVTSSYHPKNTISLYEGQSIRLSGEILSSESHSKGFIVEVCNSLQIDPSPYLQTVEAAQWDAGSAVSRLLLFLASDIGKNKIRQYHERQIQLGKQYHQRKAS